MHWRLTLVGSRQSKVRQNIRPARASGKTGICWLRIGCFIRVV
jgi:hypothetical protein